MSLQRYESGITIPPVYKEPEGFKVFLPQQKDDIEQVSDMLLDWATGKIAIGDGHKVRFAYLPRVLGSEEEMSGNDVDLRLAVFEPLYLLAGDMMDRVADFPEEDKKATAEYKLAHGITSLFSGLSKVADGTSPWGDVTKRIDDYGRAYLHLASSMGHRQMVEIGKAVEFDTVGIIYHERNPVQAVSDTLPTTTSRFGLSLSINEDDSGAKLVLKPFSREDYWKKGNKPKTLIIDNSHEAIRTQRYFTRELFGENNHIVLAYGDGFVMSSMIMKFVNDMGAGRIYAASAEHTKTLRELRETGRLY